MRVWKLAPLKRHPFGHGFGIEDPIRAFFKQILGQGLEYVSLNVFFKFFVLLIFLTNGREVSSASPYGFFFALSHIDAFVKCLNAQDAKRNRAIGLLGDGGVGNAMVSRE